MTEEADPTLAYTLPYQLTKTLHRNPYKYISASNPKNSQKGKIILITGGGTGIGAAAASVWVCAGAEAVVIAGRRYAKLEETLNRIQASSKSTRILAVRTDVVVEEDVKNLFSKVKETFGRAPDVVLCCAGWVFGWHNIGDMGAVDNFWKVYVRIPRPYLVIKRLVRSSHGTDMSDQTDPKDPVGTIIDVNSVFAGIVMPGASAYASSKLAQQRLIDFVNAEYPRLRAFTLLPGCVDTSFITPEFKFLAKDHADLTGLLALWLAQPKADFMRGRVVSVNWDVEELEIHKNEIEKDNALKIEWCLGLPINGGKRLD
ncbi:MAG: hypothetical protein Q9164_001697 [Protoblastenia rupestris]